MIFLKTFLWCEWESVHYPWECLSLNICSKHKSFCPPLGMTWCPFDMYQQHPEASKRMSIAGISVPSTVTFLFPIHQGVQYPPAQELQFVWIHNLIRNRASCLLLRMWARNHTGEIMLSSGQQIFHTPVGDYLRYPQVDTVGRVLCSPSGRQGG